MKDIRPAYHKNGHKMDYSDLDEKFTPFYISGQRIEVEWKDGYEDWSGYGSKSMGKKARFYVGRSTGWKPIYIMILRKDSTGGIGILSSAVKTIRAI